MVNLFSRDSFVPTDQGWLYLFERIGEGKPHSADVPVLAATTRDREAEIVERGIQRDMCRRLNSVFATQLAPSQTGEAGE